MLIRPWHQRLAAALLVALFVYAFWNLLRPTEVPCEFRADRWNRAGCALPPPSLGGIP